MRIFLIIVAVAAVGALVSINSSASQKIAGRSKTSARDSRAISAIRMVLDAQAAAWNRGDVEAYMDGYLRSDDVIFVSGDTLTRGWRTVMERYKNRYDSREKMGTLTLSDLEITPAGVDTAIVLGRWRLERPGDAPRGRFTLIFRKVREGWRIVHDHTSSA